jgi:hypothetical protein
VVCPHHSHFQSTPTSAVTSVSRRPAIVGIRFVGVHQR